MFESSTRLQIEKYKIKRNANLEEFKIKERKYHKAYRDKLRVEALTHYCNGVIRCQCAGCNVTELLFLTLDHLNGKGREHREITGWGWKFHLWLKRNKYPAEYRVLCFNCNSGRYLNGGKCPHEVGSYR